MIHRAATNAQFYFIAAISFNPDAAISSELSLTIAISIYHRTAITLITAAWFSTVKAP